MYEWLAVVFDGIGTEIISAVVALVIGNIGGFFVGKHVTVKQIQKAGSNSNQIQVGEINHE